MRMEVEDLLRHSGRSRPGDVADPCRLCHSEAQQCPRWSRHKHISSHLRLASQPRHGFFKGRCACHCCSDPSPCKLLCKRFLLASLAPVRGRCPNHPEQHDGCRCIQYHLKAAKNAIAVTCRAPTPPLPRHHMNALPANGGDFAEEQASSTKPETATMSNKAHTRCNSNRNDHLKVWCGSCGSCVLETRVTSRRSRVFNFSFCKGYCESHRLVTLNHRM